MAEMTLKERNNKDEEQENQQTKASKPKKV